MVLETLLPLCMVVVRKIQSCVSEVGMHQRATSPYLGVLFVVAMMFLLGSASAVLPTSDDGQRAHAWAPTEMTNIQEMEYLSSFAIDVAISGDLAVVGANTADNQLGDVNLFLRQDGQFTYKNSLRSVFDIPAFPVNNACRFLGTAIAMTPTALVTVCGIDYGDNIEAASDRLYMFAMDEEGFDTSVSPEMIYAPQELRAINSSLQVTMSLSQ